MEPTLTNGEQEGAIYARAILDTLDRLITCVEGMDTEQLNWRPPAPGANSVYVLATHTLGNAEESILYTLRDQPSTRDREREFAARAQSLSALQEHWQDLREHLQAAMLGFSDSDLARTVKHPRRGLMTGREVLLVVARHAAEHLGQAELTRDLAQALKGT
ncbi:MAG: DinB family protein [Chloroflexota bacterium]